MGGRSKISMPHGNEVFEFLVSCIALAEQVPVSQMLVFGVSIRAGVGRLKKTERLFRVYKEYKDY